MLLMSKSIGLPHQSNIIDIITYKEQKPHKATLHFQTENLGSGSSFLLSQHDSFEITAIRYGFPDDPTHLVKHSMKTIFATK